MGELHLEIIVDRLRREFKVDANVGKPQVAYRETITDTSATEGKYIRQTGGRGQYGHVKIRVEPLERGEGFQFHDQIKGGVIPKEFIPAVEKGIVEAMETGVVSGYPVVDIAVTLYDGSFHDVDSSEIAFKIAGSMAFKEAVHKSSPVVLEPVMKLEVVVPEAHMGTVIGDLSSRRGRVSSTEMRGAMQAVKSGSSAWRNVRLRDPVKVNDRGERVIHYGIFPLFCSACQHSRRDKTGSECQLIFSCFLSKEVNE